MFHYTSAGAAANQPPYLSHQSFYKSARELLQFLGHQHQSVRVIDYINYLMALSLISCLPVGAVLLMSQSAESCEKESSVFHGLKPTDIKEKLHMMIHYHDYIISMKEQWQHEYALAM